MGETKTVYKYVIHARVSESSDRPNQRLRNTDK